MCLRCARCAKNYVPETLRWRCQCGGHLNWEGETPMHRARVTPDGPGLWRYAAGLPCRGTPAAGWLGEGMTPLISRPWKGRRLLFKLDFLMPTGSFKDRGAALVVHHLQKLGATTLTEDSSGNGGAAMAAYAAAAGLGARIYVPAGTSAGKTAQIRAYGARLIPVEGDRTEVEVQAQEDPQGTYAGHNWHPLFVTGMKTLAYEIWEQMGWQVPDAVVLPAGNGSALLGAAAGFGDLQAGGAAAARPRLYAVQAEACAPLVRAFAQGTQPAGVSKGTTMAEGLRVRRPVRTAECLQAVRESGGRLLAVSEGDIRAALRALWSSGLYVEPTAAVAPAGVGRLYEQGLLDRSQQVVVLLTGHGLKAPHAAPESPQGQEAPRGYPTPPP